MNTYARTIQTQNKGVFTTLKDFQYVSKLGTGSFGNVNLYIHKQNQQKYAIKIISGTNIQNKYEAEGIEREIRTHLKCKHENIIKLYDAFYEDDSIYLVLEYVERGNLFGHIQRNPSMGEPEVAKYLYQICLALIYMHEQNIFHRDIKPENLLLDDKFNLKLCDFGWCAENIHQKRRTFCGTYEYMAPEIVNDTPYDYKIDIWSLGILIFEMLHKEAPFKGKNFNEICEQIKLCQPKIKAHVSKEAQQLIQKLLQLNPDERWSLQQIIASPFVKKNYKQITSTKSLQEQQPQQENVQPHSPNRKIRFISPKRKASEVSGQVFRIEQKMAMHSPKSQHQNNSKHYSQAKVFISPERRIGGPKGRVALEPLKLHQQGPIDLRGKDATKIIYMNLCNNSNI